MVKHLLLFREKELAELREQRDLKKSLCSFHINVKASQPKIIIFYALRFTDYLSILIVNSLASGLSFGNSVINTKVIHNDALDHFRSQEIGLVFGEGGIVDIGITRQGAIEGQIEQ